MGTVHVIGAGLAGLSAALRLTRPSTGTGTGTGGKVVIHEAAGHAGGRCRSLHDDTLGCLIDNGNHLLLAGNTAAMAYLDEIGARDTLFVPDEPAFPFFDLASGARWTVRPNRGRLPWWIFSPSRRVPGTRARDYLAARRLGTKDPQATVSGCLDDGGALFQRFWEPLAVSILNTAAEEGAASLLWPVFVEIFGRGGAAARPCLAREGLSASLVEPALVCLRARGAEVRFGQRLRALEDTDGRVTGLDFGDGPVRLEAGDQVVLAVPPAAAASLLPGIEAPTDSRPIVNAHFRLEAPPETANGLPFLGLVGGAAHWLFIRGPIVSVTVSAAVDLVDEPADTIARKLWADVARALERPAGPLPPWRVLKEKRATFAQTPAAAARRPGTRTRLANLALAGDWTDTGLPATIEGAIRSGIAAAEKVTIS